MSCVPAARIEPRPVDLQSGTLTAASQRHIEYTQVGKKLLYNRQQRVVINDSASEQVPVTNGVPQRFVWFIICINDINVRLNNLIKFANYTKIGNQFSQMKSD